MSKISIGQAPSTLIPKYIGSDFDSVITVAGNIEDVKKVAAIPPEDLAAVADAADEIVIVGDNIEYVIDVAEGLHGMPVTTFTGANPPAVAPIPEGSNWYCTENGRTYLYYVDADSGQWVESTPQSGWPTEVAGIYNGIRDGVTVSAPTENAVYDALVLKADAEVVNTALDAKVGKEQLAQVEGLTTAPGWGTVPYFTDPELGDTLNAQAIGLTARSEMLRVDVGEALRRSYAEAGYTLVSGSFELGGTVTTATDVLLYGADGKAYSWGGALPKTVPAGSTPETAGGFGADKWIPKTDQILREDLDKLRMADKLGILVGKMWAGGAVRIACYGDSTTDGNNTTGWTPNPTDASGNAIGNSDHNLTAPNAWPVKLQNILREMNKGSAAIEVWNAGYSGKQMQNGWAVNNYQQAVIDNPYYGLPDITVICFGWNDVGQPGSAIDNYVAQYRILLQRIINDGTVPVLLTTDAAIMNGTSGNNRDNKEARRELDSALKSLAAEFNIPIWDIGLELKGWIQNNNDGFNWPKEQDDSLHFSDNGHAFKAQYFATQLFNDVVQFHGGAIDINTWSSQSAYVGNWSSIFRTANNKQGGCAIYSTGAPTLTDMVTMWVWSDCPSGYVIYNGIENEGYENRDGYTIPPKVSVKEFFGSTSLTKDVISAGNLQSSTSRTSDEQFIHSRLKYGLNKVTYTSGDNDTIYYGPFRIVESSKKLAGNVLAEHGRMVTAYPVGMPTAIHPLPEAKLLNNTAGGFDGEKVSISFDITCPRSTGVLLLHGQGYTGQQDAVDNNMQNAVLMINNTNGSNSIQLYEITYDNTGSKSTSLLATSASSVWPAGNFVGRFEMEKVAGKQRLSVFDAWAGGNVLLTVDLADGNMCRWSGLVGGTYAYSNVPTAAVASINAMVINR